MMMNKAILADIMSQKLMEVKDNIKVDSTKSDFTETKLFGEGAALDSIGLVTFLVGVEQEINDRFLLEVSLMDERAFSRNHSPFRTISTLIDYIMEMGDGKHSK